jgi:sugar/nucleoside kinase (ribokinase family)
MYLAEQSCYRAARVDVLTVGEAFDDLIFAGLSRLPRPGEELRAPQFTAAAGGGALITAVACARMGLRAGTMTAVSKARVTALAAEGLAVTNLMRAGEQPALTVALSLPGDRAFVTFEGVNQSLEPRFLTALRRLSRRPRHVHFALCPRSCAAWIPITGHVRERGATTSWDFGWNDRLLKDRAFDALQASVDWLFLNDAEARLYGRVVRRRNTVIKRGPRGATALVGDKPINGPAARARVVDSTGAGDAFNAGFLAALLHGATPAQALRLGNYVAARSIEALGGISGLPYRRALPRWALQYLEAA